MGPDARHTDVVVAISWAELALAVALILVGLWLLWRRLRRGA